MKGNQKARDFADDDQGIIFELLIGAVFALIIGYTAMTIGIYITGTVADSLVKTYPTTLSTRTAQQNISFKMLANLTTDLGSNTKMVSVAYLITIITLPLMAVVVIKKML